MRGVRSALLATRVAAGAGCGIGRIALFDVVLHDDAVIVVDDLGLVPVHSKPAKVLRDTCSPSARRSARMSGAP
ncbi:hypothetical protein A4G27_03360 [Mycobacterium kansasii]|nr:hypothetical protein A4G27_03360 [Mycobacterium kansasii]